MQNYHRFLNLPFNVSKPTQFEQDFDDNQHIILEESVLDVDFKNWLRLLGCEIIYLEAFYTAPYESINVHSDDNKLSNRCKINVTWGDYTSKTRWWKIKDEKLLQTRATPYGTEHLLADEKDCDLIYEATISKPSLVNVGMLHSTYNPSSEGRWTLCVIPGKNNNYIDWQNGLEIFSNYIDKTNERH